MQTIGSQKPASLVATPHMKYFFSLVESRCICDWQIEKSTEIVHGQPPHKRKWFFAAIVAFSARKCSSREKLVGTQSEPPTKVWSGIIDEFKGGNLANIEHVNLFV